MSPEVPGIRHRKVEKRKGSITLMNDPAGKIILPESRGELSCPPL